MMTSIADAFGLAVAHHRHGRISTAEAIYRLILSVDPDNAPVLRTLGLITAPDEAVALLQRADGLQPGHADTLLMLAHTLQVKGALDEAIAAYERALCVRPDHPDIPFRLGYLLQAQGRLREAARWYERAIAVAPGSLPALCNLGAIHTALHRRDAAAERYRQALAIDPDLVMANMNMASLLEAEGQLAAARPFRARVPRPQDLVVEPALDPQRTVLILATSGQGNVPLDLLLPRQTTTRITWHVEYATEAQQADLPPYDVAFNAVGNADLADESAWRIGRLHASRPVLNPPDAVARTRRDRLPALLAGLPDVVVPPVLRLPASAYGEAEARMREAGLMCPVLVRPIVSHGGGGVLRIDTPAALAALEFGEADAHYVVAYQDCREPDGFFRKYRMVFVDREPYPYHLAISENWLVHYFSADMLAAPWKREEERRFLTDPRSVLGARAVAAVAAIGRRLNLDFAGVDFAVQPDGQVVVFEANATMLVHLHEPLAAFPDKHVCVPKIVGAFEAMLARRSQARGLAA